MHENFGSDPLLVTKMTEKATFDLQGGSTMPDEYLAQYNASMIAAAKHCCVYGFSGLDG